MNSGSADLCWVVAELDGTCELSPDEIGRKAWSLNRMSGLGLPVPAAFVINPKAAALIPAAPAAGRPAADASIAGAIWARIADSVSALGSRTGRGFGSGPEPLLLSVRSGAAVSMPGMMETVLGVGVNPAVEVALARATGNPDHAARMGQRLRAQLGKAVQGGCVPGDPWDQLRCAIGVVHGSWACARAVSYRRRAGRTAAGPR